MTSQAAAASRLTIEVDDSHKRTRNFAKDVLEGLSKRPKRLLPLYFYDERGSKLFEEICRLPEYYITRIEHGILKANASEIVSCSGGSMALVELGSGSSFKTRILIEALLTRQGVLRYFPIDISESIIMESARQLLKDYPQLEISAHVAEFSAGVHRMALETFDQKMVLFLGSNLGNFDPQDARDFLLKLRRELSQQDYLLLGTDMQKDTDVLEPAYDDCQGVTAEFNLNLLRRINRELAGEFELADFSHLAFYNGEKNRIEMHIRSNKAQDVFIGELQRSFSFIPGETIHTENSYKYSVDQVAEISAEAGFKVVNRWEDERGYFSLNLLSPA
jgi:L-histidine N-alpha-methyltransferase